MGKRPVASVASNSRIRTASAEAADPYPEFYFATPRDEVFAFVPRESRRVLEVGCGSGAFRSHFPAQVEYWGIELEKGPAKDAAKHLTRVLVGNAESCLPKLPAGYFDLVVCNDVIEHMPDHRRFLRDVQRVMAPAAAMVGSVPNVRLLSNLARLLFKRDWEYIDSGVLDYTHLHFFTQKSLRRELVNAGFAIEKLAGINPLGGRDRGPARLLKTAVGSAASLLLGRDTRFVQFAFRARLGGQH